MNNFIKLVVEDTFTITGRGLVVLLNGQTDLGVGTPHKMEVVTPDGDVFRTEGYKEWILNRKQEPVEKEGFLLMNLSKKEVPVGSHVTFK